jgi:hypothetical protein
MTPADDRPVPRLLPGEPLPSYAFVPGKFPHPESDPAGHSFGVPRPVVAAISPDDWRDSRAYLRGLDLFNAGYYWESHVEFESLWAACGRRGDVAGFLKGLIKLAAAGVKHREGVPRGVRSHATGAAGHWRRLECAETFLGFRLGELIELADTIARDGWPEPAPLLLPALPDLPRDK